MRPSPFVASGSALPGPLVWEIEKEMSIARVDGVVTVVDCANFARINNFSRTAKIQAKCTDLVLLNKVELAGEDLIDARIRERSDGVLLGIWGGRTHEIDGLEEPLGLRMVLDGQTWLLPNQFDPSELRTDVTGKLIRYLQDDGGEVVAGKPFAEVEAMKMVMAPVRV